MTFLKEKTCFCAKYMPLFENLVVSLTNGLLKNACFA